MVRPRRIQELRARASRRGQELEQRLGRSVTTAELVEELGVDAGLVREATTADGGFVPWSLDAPVDAESGTSFGATLSVDGDTDQLVDRLALRRTCAVRHRRERMVLKWRFEEGLPGEKSRTAPRRLPVQVSRILRRSLQTGTGRARSPSANRWAG